MNINFFERTNLKRGFLRLLTIASLVFFSWGAYYDFSPSSYLYSSEDYDDLIGRATFDLSDEKCNKSILKYVHPIDEPNNFSALVCEAKKETFCTVVKNCNGLEKYANILDGKKYNFEINVKELSPNIIKESVKKIQFERRIDMFKERGLNGYYNVINLWVFAFSIMILFYVLRWIYIGFKKE